MLCGMPLLEEKGRTNEYKCMEGRFTGKETIYLPVIIRFLSEQMKFEMCGARGRNEGE